MLAGCGGGEPSYADQGDAVCDRIVRRANADLERFTSGSNQSIARHLDVLGTTSRVAAREFARPEPPGDLAGTHRALIASEAAAARTYSRGAARVRAGQDRSRVLRDVYKARDRAGKVRQDQYRRLGFKGCLDPDTHPEISVIK